VDNRSPQTTGLAAYPAHAPALGISEKKGVGAKLRRNKKEETMESAEIKLDAFHFVCELAWTHGLTNPQNTHAITKLLKARDAIIEADRNEVSKATEAKVREEYAGLVERQRKYLRAAENLLTGISIHNERVVRDENSRYYISGPVVDDFKDEFRKLKAALEGKVSQ
jgi:hypothetical protein